MTDELTEQFERVRPHLRRVAYRLLGSPEEAEDAVQEAWLRLHRSDTSEVANLDGWLTTVVARISLDMLRSRSSRREHLSELPDDPGYAVTPTTTQAPDPAEQAVLADTVGVALFVVLDRLKPGERIAFVLHDLFGVSFDEIAPVVARRRPPPGSWPVAPGGACAVRTRSPRATSPPSVRWSTPSSPRPAVATCPPCSGCSTPT
jgi:RNA polymerase sigma-70 factor (ECF subfamily)